MEKMVELEFTIEALWEEFRKAVIPEAEPGSSGFNDMKSAWYCAIFDYQRAWSSLDLEEKELRKLWDQIHREAYEFIRKDIAFRQHELRGGLND